MGKRLPGGTAFAEFVRPRGDWTLSPTRASRAQMQRSILLGEEDRQDARRRLRISRIGRTEVDVTIVVVNLPVDLLAAMIEAAEIVLAVRIVVRIELLEGPYVRENLVLHVHRQCPDAGRQEELPAGEQSPQ